jgi:hypothetical protein
MQTKKMTIIAALLLACLGAATALILATRLTRGKESAAAQARLLIQKVGGAGKICSEANRIFTRFGVNEFKLFSPSELSDYPAISGLGKVDAIYPGDPPYIKIRVGTHINGYIIAILDTNGYSPRSVSPDEVEVIKPCVFVHR